MAQKTRVIITDDIDGSADAKSYTFAWQGTTYEIDLSDENRDEFLRALDPYISNGRKTGGSRGRSSSGGRGKSDAANVREWARANGFTVPDRGRIPGEVLQAYEAR